MEIARRDRMLYTLFTVPTCPHPGSYKSEFEIDVKYEEIQTSKEGKSSAQGSMGRSTGMLGFDPTQRFWAMSLESLESKAQPLGREEYVMFRSAHYIARSRKQSNEILNKIALLLNIVT